VVGSLEIRKILVMLNMTVSRSKHEELRALIAQTTNRGQDARLEFPEFLVLMKRMMDIDFLSINSAAKDLLMKAGYLPEWVLEKMKQLMLNKYGDLEGAFNALDQNHSQGLDRGEFAKLIRPLGLSPAEEEEVFQHVDTNHSGSISMDELMHALTFKPRDFDLS